MPDAIAIHTADSVAVALRDLPAGPADVAGAMLVLTSPVPLGHKIARHAIAAGALVTKYGAPIGAATAEIAAGDHVHVHNLRSRRARAPEVTP